MKILTQCERYFTPVGRIIVGAFFLLAGVGKLAGFAGVVGYVDSVGLPMAQLLAASAVVIEIGAGGALIMGYKTKYAAMLLAVFTFLTAVLFHGPSMWNPVDPTQQTMFMKNLAIMGGLLFMAAHVGAACCNPKHHHEDLTPTPSL